MTDVKNRWVFITGASRGIGRETAKAMAALGANLIIHCREASHAEGIVKELSSLTQVKVVAADLGSETSTQEMLGQIDSSGIQVDFIFNNAGMMSQYFPDALSNTIGDLRLSWEVNFRAPVQIAYHFLPKMLRQKFGRIQMTVSDMENEPELMAYACAKSALFKFVKDFARKLENTGVMMNAMNPGWTRTDLGGPKAPNAIDSVFPGALLGVLLDDQKSGRWFNAQDFNGFSIEKALESPLVKF